MENQFNDYNVDVYVKINITVSSMKQLSKYEIRGMAFKNILDALAYDGIDDVSLMEQ